MPQNPQDPWAAFRPKSQTAATVPVEAQPFPGAQPITVKRNPAKVATEQQAAIRTEIDQHGDRRADQGVAMEAERLRLAQEEAARKRRSIEANGGIETHADENTAAGLAYRMQRNLDFIRVLQDKNPDALKPGLRETLGSLSSNQFLRDASIPANVRSARIQMNNMYKDFVQNAIYAASGAAFNQDEMTAKLNTIAPSYWDDPEIHQQKMYAMETEIGAAMIKAGAAQEKVDAALAKFRELTKPLNTLQFGVRTPMDQESAPEYKLSTENKTVPIPEPMQREFQSWMDQHPPGTLKVGDFVDMYQRLAQKYDTTVPMSSIQASDEYVKAYNSGRGGTTIPAMTRPLTEQEKQDAEVSGSSAGTFLRNLGDAGSFGMASFLAGREGRYAAELADKAHPTAAMAGEVAGSILPTEFLERLAAKGAAHLIEDPVKRRVLSEVAANATYGGGSEAAKAEPGERISAAEGGALGGAGGTLVARGLVKGAKGFMGKEAGDALDKELSAQDFPIPSERELGEAALPKTLQGQSPDTLAQIRDVLAARIQNSGGNPAPADVEVHQLLEEYLAKSPEGSTGTIPKADLTTFQRMGAGRAEEFLQGLPGVHGAREAAMTSWNTKKAAEILAGSGMKLDPKTAPGRETIAAVESALSDGYTQTLRYVKGSIDRTFDNAAAGLRRQALSGGGPERQKAWADVESALAQFRRSNGDFTGKSYKEFTGRLQEISEKLGSDGQDVASMDVAKAADELALRARELVGRANPAAYNRLKKLDKSWAKFKDMQRASIAGPVLSGRGVVTPDDMLNSMKVRDTSPDKGDFAAGRYPGQKEMEDARDILGGRPVKKGSLKETGVGLYVGGALAAIPGVAAYAPLIKRATQALVDGKLGATPKAVERFLGKSPVGQQILQHINADQRRILIQQILRSYMTPDN